VVGRVCVAHHAVNLAEAVDEVVVRLVAADVFEQPARAHFERGAVVRREGQHVALGRVVDDADRLAPHLRGGDFDVRRAALARQRDERARVVRRLVVGDDAPAVAVTLVIVFLLDEPDLFGPVVGQVVGGLRGRTVRRGRAVRREHALLETLREVRVDAARRPGGRRVEAEERGDEADGQPGVEGVADAVEAEVEARGERGLVLAQKFEARLGGGGEHAAELADDEAVEPEVEQSLVVAREEFTALERRAARDELVEARAARGL
jgi:hypothetical protein